MNSLNLRASFFLSALLILPAGWRANGQESTRYFGGTGKDAPVFQLVHEMEDDTFRLVVEVPGKDHLPVSVFSSGPVSAYSDQGQTFAGRSTFDGTPIRWKAQVESENMKLIWLEPEVVTLRDGRTLSLKGEHPRLEASIRLARAAEVFQSADAELNRTYGELKKQLSAEIFDRLRLNQRVWLRYRDYITYDGDNSGEVGPGTAAHTWKQAKRTLDRVEFLNAYGRAQTTPPEKPDGFYSDGKGFRLHLSSGPGDRIFFSLHSIWTYHPPEELGDAYFESLWGIASRNEHGDWEAKAADCGAFSFNDTPIPARVLLLSHGEGRMEVVASTESADGGESSNSFDAVYFHQRSLTPAELPIRRVLIDLPVDCFSVTAEPPSPEQKTQLAVTGEAMLEGSGPERTRRFRIAETGTDHLRVDVPFGDLVVRRFSRPDGSALIAVTNQNQQNRGFTLWEWPVGGEIRPVKPAELFPTLMTADFYPDEAEATKARETSGDPMQSASYSLEWDGGVNVHYPGRPSDLEPEFWIHLSWNGSGFSMEPVPVESE